MGDEAKVINIYRIIYDQGIEPKFFINDFLEILYYFKNINSLSLESTNFSLNDLEFLKIKEISNQVDSEILILFWQFTIKSLEELDIVSNQHLSIEMFLIRLIHLSSQKKQNNIIVKNLDNNNKFEMDQIEIKSNPQIISQIKNVTQEDQNKPEIQNEIKVGQKNTINSFDELIKICVQKKEMKLKYELENNVNLVSFANNRIEVSFNENLNSDFVKNLSSKLFDWTNERWIISFSKSKGKISIKENQKNKKQELLQQAKNSEIYKSVLEKFPDAELLDIKFNKED